MVRHETHAEHRIDLAAPQGVARGAPERLTVVRLETDLHQHVVGEHRRVAHVGEVELAARRRNHAVHIGRLHLVVEPIEQFLGIVGIADGAAPHRDHLVVGPYELDIALTQRVVIEAPGELETVPQRRLRQCLQEIDGEHRDVREVDEILEPRLGVIAVGIEAENDA